MLTKKQKELFVYLNNYISSNDISPSFEEMKNAVNLKSKSGIHRLITSLEQRGYIKRLKHKARAMEITKNLPNKNVNNITLWHFNTLWHQHRTLQTTHKACPPVI